MTDERLWLVEREYGDESLVELVYSSPDGSRFLVRHFSVQLLRSKEITAAIRVDADRLETVEDADVRRRYSQEVERVRKRYDPDDVL